MRHVCCVALLPCKSVILQLLKEGYGYLLGATGNLILIVAWW
jgi:hypothetical protein